MGEKSATEGIAFLANMNDWTFTKFSVSYCYEFMMMLQGRVPVRVRLFLIMNPMLAADFRKKVHIIPEAKLGEFLMDGYEDYLPDDFKSGKASTDDMVNDFIDYRKLVEKE